MSTSSRGRFIVLDGPDGCGKTTQAGRLAEWLREGGREVQHLRDPGGTELGERVRALLLATDGPPVAMRTEALLYLACRAQLVEEVIRPALNRGAWVVCERFTPSTLVYQGFAGGLSAQEIQSAGVLAIGECCPDLVLILDMDINQAFWRLAALGALDRIEGRSPEYHRRVREGFLAWSRSEDGRKAHAEVVDASADASDVERAVRKVVERALL